MGVTLRVAGDPSGIRAPAHPGDAGLDLVAATQSILEHGDLALIGTGVRVEIPVGYAGLVLPRSKAIKTGLTVTNSPGLIDSGYRGEITVGLINNSNRSQRVRVGDRIAQLVIIAVPSVEVVEVSELSPSARGESGFGSTGG